MKVIVTGATGNLGETLIKKLRKNGLDCIGVSRNKTKNYLTVKSYKETPCGDTLVHLGEISSLFLAEKAGDEYEKEAKKTITCLIKKNFKNIIYASSALLYGDQQVLPHIETDPIIARNRYCRIKKYCEEKVLSASNGCVFRIANMISLKNKNNIIYDILKQMYSKRPLYLTDESAIRDFVWIDDISEAFINCIKKPNPGVFNLGTGIGTSAKSLAETACHICNTQKKIISVKKNKNKKHSILIVDPKKAFNILKWKSKTKPENVFRIILKRKKLCV